jgi:hypothetical protein
MANLNKIKPHEFIRTFSHRTLYDGWSPPKKVLLSNVLYCNAGRWNDDKESELHMGRV